MSLLGTKEIGSILENNQAKVRRMIMERWDTKTPLLKETEGTLKENLATMYENQAKWIKTNRHRLNESTTATSAGSFETVAFPLIRRVFSRLLANEIVSVQAMNMSTGKLFYLNPKISTRRDDPDFADRHSHTPPDSAYSNRARKVKRLANGITGDTLTEFETRSLYDAYYATQYRDFGDALFDRSKGNIELITGTVTYDKAVYDVGDPAFAGFIKAKITGFSTAEQGKIVGSSGVEMDTEAFLSSLKLFPTSPLVTSTGFEKYNLTTSDVVDYNVKPQKYGQAIVNSAGELEIVLDLRYPEADYVPYSGTTGMDFTYAYNKYCDLEADSEMGEVTIDLDEVTVSVTSRKLRATWTPEFAEDVQAYQNIDAEAELTALLSETVAKEIDMEILRDLLTGAAWNDRWDYEGLSKQTGNFYGTQKDWNQTLITRINQLSAQIEKSTLRGGANWVCVSPEVGAVLNDLEYFHVSNAAPDQDSYSMGIHRIGTLQNQYTVYKVNYFPANRILIGRKGSSILEAGYIYAPYIPMELTPINTNHADFTAIRGIRTRYAKKMCNNRFYSTIRVDGLRTFGIGDLQ